MKKFVALLVLSVFRAGAAEAVNLTVPYNGAPNKVYGLNRSNILYGAPWGELATSYWWIITQPVLVRYPNYNSQILSSTYNCQGSCTNGNWQVTSPDGRLSVTTTYTSYFGSTYTNFRLKTDFYGAKFDKCNEYDLLIQADNRAVPINSVISFASQPSLGAATQYRFAWHQNLHSATQGTKCNGVNNINYVSTINGLTLKNQATGAFLHYQIMSHDSRASGPGPFFNGGWFECNNGGFWGVNDDVTIYGAPYDTPNGVSQHYSFNIKSRLSALIQNPANCLPAVSRNPNDWKLQGAYIGIINDGEGKLDVSYNRASVYTQ